MKHLIITFFVLCASINMSGCDEMKPDSDDIQRSQQETLLKEGTAQVGMPSITNFRERKIAKDILELRDHEGIITYTYLKNEMTGRLIFLGETIGYAIPYATQFTNPEKTDIIWHHGNSDAVTLPQADPNGLFSPSSAAGTWILMKDPNGDKVLPIYIESDITVSPFRLPETIADYK